MSGAQLLLQLVRHLLARRQLLTVESVYLRDLDEQPVYLRRDRVKRVRGAQRGLAVRGFIETAPQHVLDLFVLRLHLFQNLRYLLLNVFRGVVRDREAQLL